MRHTMVFIFTRRGPIHARPLCTNETFNNLIVHKFSLYVNKRLCLYTCSFRHIVDCFRRDNVSAWMSLE